MMSQDKTIQECLEKYGDIIDLPPHTSKKYPPMPMEKRAARFRPVGFDAKLVAQIEREALARWKAEQNRKESTK